MTPLQFAKTECSNYDPSGSCKGLGIKDDGSLYSFGTKPKCLLACSPIQRCSFFEQTVAPTAHQRRPPYIRANTELRHKESAEAVKLYRMETGAIL